MKHQCPLRKQSSKLAIFCIKVMVKVTRSLTLVSFERVSLVEYCMHANYRVSISYGSKVMAKVKVFFATESQTDGQTESQTARQDKKLDAPEFHSWAIKSFFFHSRSKCEVKVMGSKVLVPSERSCHMEYTCVI